MKLSTSGLDQQSHDEGEKKVLNSELWHACAGPLVSLPMAGSRVVYFPQGHSEQVAATTNRKADAHIPNYPSLPPQLICQLHNVTMHADVDTDEVYAQMTLQPLTPQEQKDTYLPIELGVPNRQPTNYFCKILTASDTSTHGGFSVRRRAAEKVFPPLDFSQSPPCQELIGRDLHDVEWKFRHVFRGQPKRHLLTTGWSVFVSSKRLVAGDSVIFIWNEKNQLFLGIRRAARTQNVVPSSVLSTDSMHIGLLAAAAHATATNSCFTIFYNPRGSPSEFVIPLSKYVKSVYHIRVSIGMRFRMLFETEESSVRRYMGTITSIGDWDPDRWPNSHWRSVKVGWDESTAVERQPRVSLWEIEPLTTFPMYPSFFPLGLKRPCYPGALSSEDARGEAVNGIACFRGETYEQRLHSLNFQSAGMFPLMQQRVDPTFLQGDLNQQYQAMMAAGLPNFGSGESIRQHMLQLQQTQYLQHSSGHSPIPRQQNQQVIQQLMSPDILPVQTQILVEDLPRPVHHVNHRQEQQLQHTYQEPYMMQRNQLQQSQQSDISSPFSKTEFIDSNSSTSVASSSMLNMLSPLCSEGIGNLMNFSMSAQSVLGQQLPQQSWAPIFLHSQVNSTSNSVSPAPYSGKTAIVEQGAQNQSLFGANVDSTGLLLPSTVSTVGTNDTDMSVIALGSSAYQSSPYGYMQDSSELLCSAGQIDEPTQNCNFVKVCKSGSVGRSLDIYRFSSYHELREELGRMFDINGLLEDPQRSGWQLVFVDRENDVLLLGDDPWEAFVNNVWYIKILSPEDVQKLGKQGVELSFNQTAGESMNCSSTSGQELISRLPSAGSFKY